MKRPRSRSSAGIAIALALLGGLGAGALALAKAGPSDPQVSHSAKRAVGRGPLLIVAAPRSGGFYRAATWNAGCAGQVGICGTARPRRGTELVTLWLRRDATRRYWTGRRFAKRRAAFRRAPLQASRHSSARSWTYGLALPRPDGAYTLRVRLQQRWHGISRTLARRTIHFAIETSPPRAPGIVSAPAASTSASTANFSFSGFEAGLSYRCQLDGQPWRRCSSPVVYASLATAHHVFGVEAVDQAGNVSPATGYAWLVTDPGPPEPFKVSGDAAGPLSPGGAPRSLALQLTNPGSTAIHVTALAASLQTSSLPPGCSADDYQISPSSLPSAGVLVPAHGAVALPTVEAPAIRMLDTGTDQDPCQGATLTLAYTGSAHS